MCGIAEFINVIRYPHTHMSHYGAIIMSLNCLHLKLAVGKYHHHICLKTKMAPYFTVVTIGPLKRMKCISVEKGKLVHMSLLLFSCKFLYVDIFWFYQLCFLKYVTCQICSSIIQCTHIDINLAFYKCYVFIHLNFSIPCNAYNIVV